MLGHLVHNEEAEGAAQTGAANKSVRDQKQQLQRGHQKARQEQFGDFGVA